MMSATFEAAMKIIPTLTKDVLEKMLKQMNEDSNFTHFGLKDDSEFTVLKFAIVDRIYLNNINE